MAIRSVSAKAYLVAKKCLPIPLPGLTTLNAWMKKCTLEEGVLTDVIFALEEVGKSLDDFQKLSVLSFDEMSLDSQHVLDPTFLKISSQSKVQVAMLRALCGSWKQPVFYQFNSNMTRTLLNEIIVKVEQAGFQVKAIVCDLGSENRAFFKELGITASSVSFPNPVNANTRVYVFADIPHCLKNIRNHLLDQGVLLPDKTLIDKSFLRSILQKNEQELKLCPKLSLRHLECSGAERMRVRPAAQLLSHHTACLSWKYHPENLMYGNFFEIVNNGFDVLNSRNPFDSLPLKSAFGTHLEEQMNGLIELKTLMENIRFRTNKGNSKKALLPCQLGFIISINSLMKLWDELKLSFRLSYILTSRLNQDCLENFFSRIRSFGGPCTHPTAPEFRYKLRLVILGSPMTSPKGSNVDNWENADGYIATRILEHLESGLPRNVLPDIEEEVSSGLDRMACV